MSFELQTSAPSSQPAKEKGEIRQGTEMHVEHKKINPPEDKQRNVRRDGKRMMLGARAGGCTGSRGQSFTVDRRKVPETDCGGGDGTVCMGWMPPSRTLSRVKGVKSMLSLFQCIKKNAEQKT